MFLRRVRQFETPILQQGEINVSYRLRHQVIQRKRHHVEQTSVKRFVAVAPKPVKTNGDVILQRAVKFFIRRVRSRIFK